MQCQQKRFVINRGSRPGNIYSISCITIPSGGRRPHIPRKTNHRITKVPRLYQHSNPKSTKSQGDRLCRYVRGSDIYSLESDDRLFQIHRQHAVEQQLYPIHKTGPRNRPENCRPRALLSHIREVIVKRETMWSKK